jgi:filamentous hemagglutinin
LIESFAGTHDVIGGKLSGLYDSQGNIKQGLSPTEKALYDRWVEAAIPLSAPFAAAQGFPPEVWNAISILLKAAR